MDEINQTLRSGTKIRNHNVEILGGQGVAYNSWMRGLNNFSIYCISTINNIARYGYYLLLYGLSTYIHWFDLIRGVIRDPVQPAEDCQKASACSPAASRFWSPSSASEGCVSRRKAQNGEVHVLRVSSKAGVDAPWCTEKNTHSSMVISGTDWLEPYIRPI